METSESIAKLAAALVKYHAKAETIKKDGKNPHFKNEYATLDNILDTVRPILAEVGLAILQFPVSQDGLTTMLLHESGEYIRGTYTMPAKVNDPQGNGSRLTYQRRYGLGAVLGVATEKDDDATSASRPAPKLPLAKGDKNYDTVVKAIFNGFTFDQIRQKYEVSKSLEAQILADSAQYHDN